MPFELTNPDAFNDFVRAYADFWGCSQAYAEKLLNELLAQRSYMDAGILRAWSAEFGDTPTQQAIKSVVNEGAARIDPTLKKD